MISTTNIYHEHDHGRCVQSALLNAKALCNAKNVRFTPIRQRVFELIWQSHAPIGAYDLLPKLAEEGFNSAPPTVYRAIDFLLELGLVHRINSLNAYTGCTDPNHPHENCFFICTQCGGAQELEQSTLMAFCQTVEKQLGVHVEQFSTELSGVCPACRTPSAVQQGA